MINLYNLRASSTSANAVTTDVSPEPTEPAILQIQGNGNDLEEEGGDTLTICCLMSWILRSWISAGYYDG
jgi:hypothetical protein